MRLLVTALLFIALQVSAQDSQEILGKWQVFAYQDELIYYNHDIDSIVVKKEVTKERLEAAKQMFEMLILQITYEFKSDQTWVLNNPVMFEIEGLYEVDEAKQRIFLREPDKEEGDWLPYQLKNDVLIMRMALQSSYIKIWLKRVEP